jgi:putative hydrolase of the HAD superfamily
MIDWEKIDTILLDMDGTLLDLSFDNHFWLEFIPSRYADAHHMSIKEAKKKLQPQFKKMEGKLEWYCLDYWSQALNLDIAGLKIEIADLISVLPHAIEFLAWAHQSHRKVFLVTNAHRDSLDLKMSRTRLDSFFDHIISSHDYGLPKEHQGFWTELLRQHPACHLQRTLLIDDSMAVLKSAQRFGIEHLVSISKPDSTLGKKEMTGFLSIEDFRELMPKA